MFRSSLRSLGSTFRLNFVRGPLLAGITAVTVASVLLDKPKVENEHKPIVAAPVAPVTPVESNIIKESKEALLKRAEEAKEDVIEPVAEEIKESAEDVKETVAEAVLEAVEETKQVVEKSQEIVAETTEKVEEVVESKKEALVEAINAEDAQVQEEAVAVEAAEVAEAEAGQSQSAAYNPETGEINWDCPCLGGMANGPCGEEFKEAFACFVYSETEPKGIDCIKKFENMRNCFREHPEHYKEELYEDDEPVPEVPSEETAAVVTEVAEQTSESA